MQMCAQQSISLAAPQILPRYLSALRSPGSPYPTFAKPVPTQGGVRYSRHQPRSVAGAGTLWTNTQAHLLLHLDQLHWPRVRRPLATIPKYLPKYVACAPISSFRHQSLGPHLLDPSSSLTANQGLLLKAQLFYRRQLLPERVSCHLSVAISLLSSRAENNDRRSAMAADHAAKVARHSRHVRRRGLRLLPHVWNTSRDDLPEEAQEPAEQADATRRRSSLLGMIVVSYPVLSSFTGGRSTFFYTLLGRPLWTSRRTI